MRNKEDLWLDDFSIIYHIIIRESNGLVPLMTHSYTLHLTQPDLLNIFLSNVLSPQNLFKYTSIYIYWSCIEDVLLNIRQWRWEYAAND